MVLDQNVALITENDEKKITIKWNCEIRGHIRGDKQKETWRKRNSRNYVKGEVTMALDEIVALRKENEEKINFKGHQEILVEIRANKPEETCRNSREHIL